MNRQRALTAVYRYFIFSDNTKNLSFVTDNSL